jgi:hypothetical protein
MSGRRILCAALCLAAAACASNQVRPSEPIIKTVVVKVPVPEPCPALEKLGPEPAYPDTDEALRKAPNIFEQVKLLLAGRAMRAVRAAAVAEALAICAGPPDEKSAPTG